MNEALNLSAIAANDPRGEASNITALGDHLKDAVKRIEDVDLTSLAEASQLVIAGMGGSGIGGRIALAVLQKELRRPTAVIQSYELPPWVDDSTVVFCSSYSGNTEEVIACYESARDSNATQVVATVGGELGARAAEDNVPIIPFPDGYQPRATIGYGIAAALSVAFAAGVAPSLTHHITDAADFVDDLVAQWGPEGPDDNPCKELARLLLGTVPVFMGAGVTAPVAYRWKCQLNENSKLPAFSGELPELDHNELVGWNSASSSLPFSAVFLLDTDEDPRVKRRFSLTQKLIEDGAALTATIHSVGDTPLQRALSLVLFGDLLSLYLATLRQVDPAEIAVLETLKRELAAAS